MMELGLYEKLIDKLIASKLDKLDRNIYYVKESQIDKAEASRILSLYLTKEIKNALDYYTGDSSIEKQINLSNKIILLLKQELQNADLEADILENGRILSAIINKVETPYSNIENYLREITPYTRLTHSELFTGNNSGISLDSEIKKEILSSSKIKFLVSFIKWSGIRIFEKELKQFTENGGELQVITTSYLGATDYKAVEYLSKLRNTEIKVSYNSKNERLHAKAYLFYRNTGFHTGYIGSSNISRSALTSGLEWNLKITTKEISHIIDKFRKTFDTYWQDKEFELFDYNVDKGKLLDSLKNQSSIYNPRHNYYFNLKPYPFQEEILDKLNAERLLHQRNKNLIVAATGTGKTIISAFDYYRYFQRNQLAKLLFVAHRKEILIQALETFRGVLKNNNFGELWVDGEEPGNYSFVFASVQTLNNRLKDLGLSPTFYDYIVIDEVHHITASSYRPIVNYFQPKILLGLTATPERMDGANILLDFSNTIAAEIRLPEALNRKLLCPFQYFGITDSVDLANVSWVNGRYIPSELTKVYIGNDKRVNEILYNLEKYLTSITDVRALGFCVSQDHAQYMTNRFLQAGLKADFLVSNNSDRRTQLREQLSEKVINYLFVVDIFNEGIDIPEIDTVLFLRPTESLTIFLQQLGRGLRLAENKECLTVMDFVGNSRPEYDFESKFRALVGRTNTSIVKEVEDDFPHLPLGCSIILERKAKDYILQNIKNATKLSESSIINKIANYKYQSELPLTLGNFSRFYHISPQTIYKRGGWKRLCFKAGQIQDFPVHNEKEIVRAIHRKWLATKSTSYFSFIYILAKKKFEINIQDYSDIERQMCLMLHYDVWQTPGQFNSLEESIRNIGANVVLVEEILEIMTFLLEEIDFMEQEVWLPYSQPLKLHSRYTRDQILAAFEFSTFEKKSEIREGVAYSQAKNSELLFITLSKSEEDFSPTTLYEDFAVSERLFHWQTQNAIHPETQKGLSYINHEQNERIILLFVRERNKDEHGNVMGSVFLGKARLVEYYGSKPMSIKWELNEPMPPYIWRDTIKMAIG